MNKQYIEYSGKRLTKGLVLVIAGLLVLSSCSPAVVTEVEYIYVDRTIEVIKVVEVEVEVPVEVEVIKTVQTVIYRYPTTPPFEAFPDPITFDQSLILLYGMRLSHVQALKWTFESDPGFGIADREFQEQCIEWYDQLIDLLWRMENKSWK